MDKKNGDPGEISEAKNSIFSCYGSTFYFSTHRLAERKINSVAVVLETIHMWPLVNRHRINAAKEIVRQLWSPSPSRFILAAKKDEWLKVNEQTRSSIIAKAKFDFEMFE